MSCELNYDLRCAYPFIQFGNVDAKGEFTVERELLVSTAYVEKDYDIESVIISGNDRKGVLRTIPIAYCQGLLSYTPSANLPSDATVESEVTCETYEVSGEFQDFCDWISKLVNCNCTATCILPPIADIGFVDPNLTHQVSSNEPSCNGEYTASLTISDSTGAVLTGFPLTFDQNNPPPATLDVGTLALAQGTYTAVLSITDCAGTASDTTTFDITISADAVNDAFVGVFNQPVSGSVVTNDVTCSQGATTTYSYDMGNVVGGSVSFFDTNTGDFTFTPNPDFVGEASFTYSIECNGSPLDTATVVITYEAPIAGAVDDSFQGTYNVNYSDNLATNDTPCSVGTTNYQLQAGSEVGGMVSALDSTTGAFQFTPTAGFIGDASFVYEQFCDGFLVDSATITINYPSPMADAIDDGFSTNQDIPVTGNVGANDTTCSDGANTTYAVLGDPVNGNITNFNPSTGEFTYAPNTGYVGADLFTYQIICDGNVLDVATATITISTFSADAVDDLFTGVFGTPYTDFVPTNDTPCSGGATTEYATVGGSMNGGMVTSFNPTTGEFEFTPNTGFVGTATFQYQILCNSQPTDVATVQIVYNTPTADAVNDTEQTNVDVPLTANLAGNDTPCSSGATTYVQVAGSEVNGTVAITDASTGDYTWTPATGFVGTGSFEYAIQCDGVTIDTAIVTIDTVAITADAVDDSFIGLYNTQYSDSVTGNDTPCSSGATAYVEVVGSATGGTLDSLDAAGNFQFTPTTGFSGNAGFSYSITCDGTVIDTAQVTISIPSPTADAVNDSFTTPQDTPLTDFVATNDVPCSSGNTTYVLNGSPAPSSGSVPSIDPNTGEFTYTPNTGYVGADSFGYDILCDGNVIDSAIVDITVQAFTADAVDDVFTDGVIDTTYNASVTANDTPCNGGASTTYVPIPLSASNGTLDSLDGAGNFQFTPSNGFVGDATFQYAIECNGTQVDVATVTITFADPCDAVVFPPTAGDVVDLGSIVTSDNGDGTFDLDITRLV